MAVLRPYFDEALEALKQNMLDMFDYVITAFDEMFHMLESNDKTLAGHLIEADRRVNVQEQRINEDAFLIILKQCPVASDLRRIMTAVKIANDLERIADYTVNVAVYVLKTDHENQKYRTQMCAYRPPLMNMLRLIKEAYATQDVALAEDVSEQDYAVDTLYQRDIEHFIAIARQETDDEAAEAARSLPVIKHFERAGDHVTNIAEHIVFLHSGEHKELN
ncbi:MAG: phosphate transport system regulatory protein PhoU [Acholeplasmatales bacterium]|nr:MAG: phosphate transport system regulatory protein PhoU [Acholeplasmatales bacterium]